MDLWDVLDTIKDAMEDILIWLLNNSRNSELMKKAVNHTETMIKLVKHHALKKKYGESQITDMLEKDTMEVLMKKL